MEDRENLRTSSRWVEELDSEGVPSMFERRTETWLEECPFCEAPVEVRQETEEWTEMEEAPEHWEHSSFGITDGYCGACDLVLVDTPDGLMYFSLND